VASSTGMVMVPMVLLLEISPHLVMIYLNFEIFILKAKEVWHAFFCVDQLETNSVAGTCIRKVLTCTLLLGHAL
jgi:hypothetical protein